MIIETLIALKNHILQYNTYFSSGFEDVSITENGMVYAHLDNSKIIFPDDTLGNYFYLRTADRTTTNYSSGYKANDCQNNFNITPSIILVACMRGTDKYQLLDNITSTLIYYSADLRVSEILGESEAVIVRELSKVKKEVRDKALANKDKNYSIISISFTVTVPYNPIDITKEDCLPNPCAAC